MSCKYPQNTLNCQFIRNLESQEILKKSTASKKCAHMLPIISIIIKDDEQDERIGSVSDPPQKLTTKKRFSIEIFRRTYRIDSIASKLLNVFISFTKKSLNQIVNWYWNAALIVMLPHLLIYTSSLCLSIVYSRFIESSSFMPFSCVPLH